MKLTSFAHIYLPSLIETYLAVMFGLRNDNFCTINTANNAGKS